MDLYRLEISDVPNLDSVDGTYAQHGMLKKFKRGFVVLNNRIYTNPTEETVRKAGYKDIVYNEKPEYDETTQCLAEIYTEDDTTIYVGYEVKEIPKEGEINDD